MHEPALVMYHEYDRSIKGSAVKKPWPKMPAAPKVEKAEATVVPKRKATKDERRSDLEVLSRLAGGTTYRTPDGVGSTRGRGIGTDDLAHALGFVKDPLDQRLALAFACRTAAEWVMVQELANPPLLQQLLGNHNTRKIVMGAKKYRARLVLHDAFHDLVLERPVRTMKDGAAKISMQPREYQALYKETAGFLETRALTGAYTACRALFGPE